MSDDARTDQDLLGDTIDFLERFIDIGKVEVLVIGLWILHSHAIEASNTTPYLIISSPEPGCGKSTLLEVLEQLAARGWKVDGAPTEATLFRKIEADSPSMLIDEADRLFAAGEERVGPLVAIVNAGNRRRATVPRCVSDGQGGWTVVDFSVFAPKSLAGINHLRWPSTVRDRAIVISLHRHAERERLLWTDEQQAQADALRARVVAWGETAAGHLRKVKVDDIPKLTPRAFAGWRPLLEIAEYLGVGEVGREAAIELGTRHQHEEPSFGVLVLGKLRELFADGRAVVTSEELARHLNADELLPFGDWRPDGVSKRRVAQLLKPFGVHPAVERIGDQVTRGYRYAGALVNALDRYLPPPPEISVTSATSARMASQRGFSVADGVTDGAPTTLPATNGADVADVTVPAGVGPRCMVCRRGDVPLAQSERSNNWLCAPCLKNVDVLELT
jgi:hypothetical protein